eukprot:55523-Hanusia_phi.AAC.2
MEGRRGVNGGEERRRGEESLLAVKVPGASHLRVQQVLEVAVVKLEPFLPFVVINQTTPAGSHLGPARSTFAPPRPVPGVAGACCSLPRPPRPRPSKCMRSHEHHQLLHGASGGMRGPGGRDEGRGGRDEGRGGREGGAGREEGCAQGQEEEGGAGKETRRRQREEFLSPGLERPQDQRRPQDHRRLSCRIQVNSDRLAPSRTSPIASGSSVLLRTRQRPEEDVSTFQQDHPHTCPAIWIRSASDTRSFSSLRHRRHSPCPPRMPERP